MATDVEESDTDDHERPDPPKRQRTRPVTSVEHKEESTLRIDNEWPVEEAEAQDSDEEERLSREKLKGWQAFQVAKGFVDNAINRVMEHYIMAPSSAGTFFLEDPRMRSFRGNEMEDTAVSMAIRNHGLVPSTNLTESNPFFSSRTLNFFTSENVPNYYRNPPAIPENYPISTSSSYAPATSAQLEISSDRNWTEEKNDESDQEHDFLERAVAEAIKKKGLSALSVDYG